MCKSKKEINYINILKNIFLPCLIPEIVKIIGKKNRYKIFNFLFFY